MRFASLCCRNDYFALTPRPDYTRYLTPSSNLITLLSSADSVHYNCFPIFFETNDFRSSLESFRLNEEEQKENSTVPYPTAVHLMET